MLLGRGSRGDGAGAAPPLPFPELLSCFGSLGQQPGCCKTPKQPKGRSQPWGCTPKQYFMVGKPQRWPETSRETKGMSLSLSCDIQQRDHNPTQAPSSCRTRASPHCLHPQPSPELTMLGFGVGGCMAGPELSSNHAWTSLALSG